MLDIMQEMPCKNTKGIEKHDKGLKPLECEDCLYFLNYCRLMCLPNTDLSITLNQESAVGRTIKHVAEMSLQEIFIYQKMHEAMAAQCSLAYNAKLVEKRIADPKELERKAEDWKRAETEMKNRNRPKVEKKQLSQFDQAVAELTKLHIDETEARRIVEERFAKQGKVTK